MPHQLEKFLRDLAKNPEKPGSLYQRYLANPRQVMQEEGLDQATINAIMAGDLKFVNDILQGTNVICATIVFG